jgi:predicted lactoylglutathione lyase
MNSNEFMIELDASYNRSLKTLMKKAVEYSGDENRLEQFYRAGMAQATTPHSALIGMATKHFTSIADMCKKPEDFTLKQWDEKVGDLRNYTFLLDALVRDCKELVSSGKD